MNTDLAEQIISIILMQPDRLDMRSFISHWADGTVGAFRDDWPCGTTACIAGHVALLTAPADASVRHIMHTFTREADDKGNPRRLVEVMAREALDIPWDVADVLFFETEDDEAVPALKYLIGCPDATGEQLMGFLLTGRSGVF